MPHPNDSPSTPRSLAEVEAELAQHASGLLGDEGQEVDEELPAELPPSDDELTPAEKQYEADQAADKAAETEASRKGWVPRAQYKGDPAKWVDAKTFIERGERFVVNLQREVSSLKAQIEGFEGTKKAFAKFYEEALEKKDKELQEAITALRVQRSSAIRDGDDEFAVQIEDRIDLLKEQKRELKALPDTPKAPATDAPKDDANPDEPPAVKTDPVILEWIEDGNTWFDEDPRLRAYALSVGDRLIKEGETVRGRRFLDKVTAIMKQEFPRKFRDKVPPAVDSLPNHVEGGDNAPNGKSGGKTEKDLPSEDRALMNQFIASGLTTKEKFLKSYFSS